MKAISLWQPWASLLACGAKQYETRSWATKYRGQIAIHAAVKPAEKTFNELEIDYYNNRPLFDTIRDNYHCACAKLPHGCVVATAELVGCLEIAEYVDGGVYVQESITGQRKHIVTLGNEGLFGDFTPGRYAWEFKDMTPLREPVPASGHQRMWNWEGIRYDK